MTGSSARDSRGGVTWRAAVIALAITLLSVPAIFYGETVWGTGYWGEENVRRTNIWSTGVVGNWPLTVLFLLAALTSLPALRRLRFSRRELMAIYSLVLVATPLPGAGLLVYVLSTVVAYYYYGHVFTHWETFLPLI
ncbi:MAG TPA: DUF6785 family protein, partial [Anaerolineae bacterium]|nr:DUF6785 family protein [Anaerolineae bacterium]